MKTLEEILAEELGQYLLKPTDIYMGTDAVKVAISRAMKQYAKLAIEEDRKNLLKYAEATYPYSSVDE